MRHWGFKLVSVCFQSLELTPVPYSTCHILGHLKCFMKWGGLCVMGAVEVPCSESLSQNLLEEAWMTFSPRCYIFRSLGRGKNAETTIPQGCSQPMTEHGRISSACPLLPMRGTLPVDDFGSETPYLPSWDFLPIAMCSEVLSIQPSHPSHPSQVSDQCRGLRLFLSTSVLSLFILHRHFPQQISWISNLVFASEKMRGRIKEGKFIHFSVYLMESQS